MRVAFLVDVNRLPRWVAAEQARSLWAQHGIEAHVLRIDEARNERWDIAAAGGLAAALELRRLEAARYVAFVDRPPDRLSDHPHITLVAGTRALAGQLRTLSPQSPVYYLRPGVDKAVFAPCEQVPPALDGPLRIAVLASDGEEAPAALAAISAMREPHMVTTADGDAPEKLAALSSRSDVVLDLSPSARPPLGPLAAFHRGATCVVTAAPGVEDYIVDGFNAMVTAWDDPRGCSRALDLLARDRRHLHELRVNALATARSWPSLRQAASMLALIMRRIVAAPVAGAAE
jgi:hypothetical protein